MLIPKKSERERERERGRKEGKEGGGREGGRKEGREGGKKKKKERKRALAIVRGLCSKCTISCTQGETALFSRLSFLEVCSLMDQK
jgi:hypothetical protein